MKTKLLFLGLFLSVFQMGYGQNRNASLQIEFANVRATYVIQLGRETFTITNNLIIIDELQSGYHPVQIYRLRRGGRILVYSGGVNLASNATTLSDFRNGHFEVYGVEPYFIEEQIIVFDPPTMYEARFRQLKSTVLNESFDSSRLELLQSTLRNNYFYAHQIKDLMTLLSFESSKLQFAKSAYEKVVDPENYFVVRNALTFSSSKTELSRYIGFVPF